MQEYCAILVVTDYDVLDKVTFGNNLADYVDGGGGVVTSTFVSASVPLAGRFHTDNYYALQPTSQTSSPQLTLGTIFNACHPVLNNVTSFNGGTSSYRQSTDSLHPSATRIANWSDGKALIVERSISGTLRIDLGFYPVSSDVRSDFWVSSTDGARILANALQYVSSCAVQTADLTLTNTDAVDPVTPGSNITYTIDVDNIGPYPASGIVIEDVLPAGTTFVSATGESSSCGYDSGTNTVTCTLAALAACADEVVTLIVNVPAGTPNGTVVTHTATVSAETTDPVPGNNTEAESTTVNAPPDLAVTKTAAPEPVVAGTNLTYTIDVDNTGGSAATAVVISDTIPAGTTFVAATGEDASCGFATGTVTCTLASLAAGTDEVITLVVQVNADVAGGTILTNMATASSTPADGTAANNQDSVDSTVSASADLSITKSGPASALPTDTITYTIQLTNAGASNAATVAWTDAIPAGTTFVSFTPAAGFSCTTPAAGATGTITCTIASMAPGTATFSLSVAVNDDPSLTQISNTASVTTTTPDPDSDDHSATAVTVMSDVPANLAVTKTAAPDPVVAGANLTYTIDVDNTGEAAATSVVITDVLPAGTTFVSATGESASCGFASGTVTCTLASLAGGTDEIITLVVNVNAGVANGTILTNQATASSTPADATPAGNQDSVESTVTVSADLSVTKSGPASALPNDTVTYTIQVTNGGPSDAATVTLTDAVPAGTTFVSFTPAAGFSCTTPAAGATGTITCSIASMAPGTAAFSLNVAVNDDPSLTQISNTASVTTTTTDPDSDDHSATAVTVMSDSAANLVVTKTAAPQPVVAGANLTYTIDVDNTGETAATSVVITDAIPTGTTYVSATGENASCGFASGTVTCTLASLAGGTDEIITLVLHVNADVAAGTVLTNTATASSTPADAAPSDNQDSVDSTVTVSADLSITKSGPPSAVPNQTIAYAIDVTNAGPSNATAVSLTDVLPAGTTFVSLVPAAGFTCTTPAVGATGTVTCSSAVMVSGTASFTLRIAIAGTSSLTGISNTASVTSTTPDPDGTDTAASATTAIAAAETAAVPSLSEWGLATLMLAMLLLGALRLKG